MSEANPQHVEFYNTFFRRAATSKAHAQLCERVYGRDLCQHGMLDMPQLAQLLALLAPSPSQIVLELGCGNGALAAYIAETTGVQVVGVDSSPVGIEQARARTPGKRERLTFICGDMARVAFPPASFDFILAIDSVYFVQDLVAFLERLTPVLRPGGAMAIFYSSSPHEGIVPDELTPDGNRLARALREVGLTAEVRDFSLAEAAHWRLKLAVAEELRAAFEAEGNEFLFQNRYGEARQHTTHVQAGQVRRYLYLVPRTSVPARSVRPPHPAMDDG